MIQSVNLYTAELRPRTQQLSAAVLVLAVAIMLVAVTAGGGWYRVQADSLQQTLVAERTTNDGLLRSIDQLGAQVAARKPDPALEAAIERVTSALARRQRLLERVERLAYARSEGFATPMSALARQIPEGLWLTHILLRSDQVFLAGRTRAGSRVPVYLEQLGEEPAFQGQVFGRFQLTRNDEQPWIEFQVATRRDGKEGS